MLFRNNVSKRYNIPPRGGLIRKVYLRINESEKYNIIKELVNHNGNKNRAALKLNLSRWQINRLIIKYKEIDKSVFIHSNHGRRPINSLDKSISSIIVTLYKEKYYDFNFSHFKEFLDEKENIKVSYTFIYKTLSNEGILSPKTRKETKKKAAKQKLLKEKKINNKMKEKEI